jgi:hypothetical protein
MTCKGKGKRPPKKFDADQFNKDNFDRWFNNLVQHIMVLSKDFGKSPNIDDIRFALSGASSSADAKARVKQVIRASV